MTGRFTSIYLVRINEKNDKAYKIMILLKKLNANVNALCTSSTQKQHHPHRALSLRYLSFLFTYFHKPMC